jgi:hypothetical protein
MTKLKLSKRRSNSKSKGPSVKVMVSNEVLPEGNPNTHVRYESHSIYQSKVTTRVKVFEKKVKL